MIVVAGGLGIGIGGVGGAVDVGIIRNDTTASIADGARVSARDSVHVNALSNKDVHSFAISAAGGVGAGVGSVSVWSIGAEFDAHYEVGGGVSGTISEDSLGGRLGESTGYADRTSSQLSSMLEGYSDSDSDPSRSGPDNQQLQGTHARSAAATITARTPSGRSDSALDATGMAARSGVTAFIASNATVVAGHDVNVRAKERIVFDSIVGSLANGAGVLGASVAVANISSLTDAYVGAGASIQAGSSSGDDVCVEANLIEISKGSAYAGQAGVVTLGAQVSVLNDSSEQRAHIDGNITQAGGTVTVLAKADRTITAEAKGGSFAGVGAGASVGVANAGGETEAYVRGDIGQAGSVGDLGVNAESNGSVKADVIAVAAGILGALDGSIAVTTNSPTVAAEIRSDADVEVDGSVTVHALSTTDVEATAHGVSLAVQAAGGGSVASANETSQISASVRNGARVVADGSINITAEHNPDGTTPRTRANAQASGGAILAVLYSSALASESTNVLVSIGDRATLAAGGDLRIISYTANFPSATAGAFSISGGGAKFLNVEAETEVSNLVQVGDDALLRAGPNRDLEIRAESHHFDNDVDDADAVADGGGGGALDVGDTTTSITVDDSTSIDLGAHASFIAQGGNVTIETVVRMAPFAQSTVESVGLVNPVFSKSDVSIDDTTSIRVREGVLIDVRPPPPGSEQGCNPAEGGNVSIRADVSIVAEAFSHGFAVGAATLANADSTADIDSTATVDLLNGTQVLAGGNVTIEAVQQSTATATVESQVVGVAGQADANGTANVSTATFVTISDGALLRGANVTLGAESNASRDVNAEAESYTVQKVIEEIPIIGDLIKAITKFLHVNSENESSNGSVSESTGVQFDGVIELVTGGTRCLLINPNGSIAPGSNIGAHIVGTDYVVDDIVNAPVGEVNITAENNKGTGTVSGNGEVHLDLALDQVKIENFSDKHLVLGLIDFWGTPATPPVNISASNDPAFDIVIGTLSKTPSLLVTNQNRLTQATTDVRFRGNINNPTGRVNITNLTGSILNDDTATPSISGRFFDFEANRGSIGLISNKVSLLAGAGNLIANASTNIELVIARQDENHSQKVGGFYFYLSEFVLQTVTAGSNIEIELRSGFVLVQDVRSQIVAVDAGGADVFFEVPSPVTERVAAHADYEVRNIDAGGSLVLSAADGMHSPADGRIHAVGPITIRGDFNDTDTRLGSTLAFAGPICSGTQSITITTADDDDIIQISDDTEGAVLIESFGGNDTITVVPDVDLPNCSLSVLMVFAGDGNDVITGSAGPDILVGGAGDDVIVGGKGDDVLIGDEHDPSRPVQISASSVKVFGLSGSGRDFLVGGDGRDYVFGCGGDDVLFGGNAPAAGTMPPASFDEGDFLDGGTGNDLIYGDDGNVTYDFATLSGTVWLDLNADGIQTPEEPVRSGATVRLFDTFDGIINTNDQLLAIVTTDAAGHYSFDQLLPGRYYLQFDSVAGFTFTTPNQGLDDTTDSDVTPATGRTAIFPLVFGQDDDTHDAGLIDGVGLTIDNASVSEVNGGNAQAVFTVHLSAPRSQQVRVQYETRDGTAVGGTDYSAVTSGEVVIEAGQLEGHAIVQLIEDALDEINETFVVRLRSATGAAILAREAIGTIVDNDAPPTVSISNATIVEGDAGTVLPEFQVTLSQPSGRFVTVQYSVVAGTFLFVDSDFNRPRELAQRLAQHSDALSTALWNRFALQTQQLLSNPTSTVATLRQALASGFNQLLTNGPLFDATAFAGVTLSARSSALLSENAQGADLVRLNRWLLEDAFPPPQTPGSPADITSSPTAIFADATQDFGVDAGELIFAPGTTTLTLTIKPRVFGDALNEENELFYVVLTGSSDSTIDDGLGEGTITDDDAVPQLTIQDAAIVEGDTGQRQIVFQLQLSAPSGRSISVDYATANGSALAPSDYLSTSGHITLQPGVTRTTISVTVLGDTVPEEEQSFLVVLSHPLRVTLFRSQALGSIIDDESAKTNPAGWNIQFDRPIFTGIEGDGQATIMLTRPDASVQAVVFYTLTDGTAVADSDYVFATGAVVFARGETTKTFTVGILDNNQQEQTEFLTLSLHTSTGRPLEGTLSEAQLRILDDDPKPVVSVRDVSVDEGNSGSSEAVFIVRLNNVSPRDISVNYQTVSESANSADFVNTIGVLTIPAGSLTGRISVTILGDTRHEADETFRIELSVTSFAKPGDMTAECTIRNDDAPPLLRITGTTVVEGQDGLTDAIFHVTLTGLTDATVTVDYDTEDGSATVRDGDYLPTNGTLTFAPGVTDSTITVLVKGDIDVELDQRFFVNLTISSDGEIRRGQATCVILTDDGFPVHGLVFEDSDGNGVRGPKEGPLEGVVVQLLDSSGALHFATSGPDGTYTANVALGQVALSVDNSTLPAGYVLTTRNALQLLSVSLAGANASDLGYRSGQRVVHVDPQSGNAAADTIFGGPGDDEIYGFAGDDLLTGGHWLGVACACSGNPYDAVILIPNNRNDPLKIDPASIPADGSITGRVLTGLTTGLAGIQIRLWYLDAERREVLAAQTLTDSTGRYTFTNVCPMTYFLEIATPAEYDIATGADVATGRKSNITVAPAQNVNANDVRLTLTPNALFRFEQPYYIVDQSAGHFDVTIVRTDTSGAAALVYWLVSAAGRAAATLGSDFVVDPTQGLVYFAPGQARASISVTLLPDSPVEPPEAFGLELYSLTGRPVPAPRGSTVVTIVERGVCTDDDILEGGLGNDVLLGDYGYSTGLAPQNVVSHGGDGNDTYLFDADDQLGTDLVVELPNGGIDTLDFSSTQSQAVTVDLARSDIQTVTNNPTTLRLQLFSGNSVENIVGGDQADRLTGNALDNTFTGRLGNDIIDGRSGNDRILEQRDSDFVLANDSLLIGANERDTLTSIEEADLTGGSSANRFTVSGWPHKAFLDGSGGMDTIIATNDSNFTLSDSLLLVDPTGEFHLTSIEKAILTGGLGQNTIDASAFSGSTVLAGGPDNDIIFGGSGSDTITGGPGSDTLAGGPENDSYLFADGNVGGDDTILELANGGTDTLDFSGITSQTVTIDLSNAGLQGVLAGLTLTLSSNLEIENVTGGGGSDRLTGNLLNNQLNGGPGNDTYVFDIDSALGSDTIVDSSGSDTLDFSGTTTLGVTVDLSLATLQLVNANNNLTLTLPLNAIDNVVGSSQGDRLTGNLLNNQLNGGPGNDTYIFDIDTALGSDTIFDSSGSDTLDFSGTTTLSVTVDLSLATPQLVNANGNLTLTLPLNAIENVVGGSQGDRLTGNLLNNQLNGGPGNDTYVLDIDNFLGIDTIVDSGGIDTLDFAGTTSLGVTADLSLATSQLVNASGNLTLTLPLNAIENVIGGSQGDRLTGNLLNNQLNGGLGNDTYVFDIDTALGSDTIFDSSGSDTLDFSGTTTLIVTVDLSLATSQLVNANGNLRLTLPLNAIENVIGGSQGDRLTGNLLNNQLNGGPGNDTYVFDIDSVLGSDTIVDSGGSDTLDFSGTTTLSVTMDLSLATPQLINANGNFTLTLPLNAIENVIGGSQGDRLTGNLLNNQLNGGPGNDTYAFDIDSALGSDTIVDSSGSDTLDFSGTTTLSVTMDLSLATPQLVNANNNLTLTLPLNGIENVVGGSQGDRLTGNLLNNQLTGGPGDDTIIGGAGTDTVTETRDADFVLTNTTLQIGPSETDTYPVGASIEIVILTGGASANRLDASAFSGSVNLNGVGGSDTLIGGAGSDTLTGGDNDDTYIFDADFPSGTDKIVETTTGGTNDIVDLSRSTPPIGTLDRSSTAVQRINANLSIILDQANTIETVINPSSSSSFASSASISLKSSNTASITDPSSGQKSHVEPAPGVPTQEFSDKPIFILPFDQDFAPEDDLFWPMKGLRSQFDLRNRAARRQLFATAVASQSLLTPPTDSALPNSAGRSLFRKVL